MDSDFEVEVSLNIHVHGAWINYYLKPNEPLPQEQIEEILAANPQWAEELVRLAVLDSLDAPAPEGEGEVPELRFAVVKRIFEQLPEPVQQTTGGLDRFREMTLKTGFGLWPIIHGVRFDRVTPVRHVHPLLRSRND